LYKVALKMFVSSLNVVVVDMARWWKDNDTPGKRHAVRTAG
jgi:hypothetical protein